ncbi:Hypothetical protein A7982_05123 [Minicystis rosea]|nr:Hypothetical protein A7982_05123 [Minicystis rosea]
MKNTRPSIDVVCHEPAKLTHADRDEIERFVIRHSNWSRQRLDEALDAATYVWLCYDGRRLIGSTAVKRLSARLHGREVTVIYTSVVAVDHAYRRLGLIARMGMKSFFIERMRAPLRPIYWLALAGSPAGYLQMTRNFETFWPRAGVEMPDGARTVLEQSLSALGITDINRVEGSYVLTDDFGVLDKDQDPEHWDRSAADVDFFLRVNPEYRRGFDLACLCPLELTTLGTSFLRRTLLRPTRARRAVPA